MRGRERRTIEKLKDNLISKVSDVITLYKNKDLLRNKKISLLVTGDKVVGKIILPVEKNIKYTKMTPELVKKIKEIKRILKDRRDSIYLYTLLMSLHSELNKLKLKKLDEKSKEVLFPVLSMVKKDLGNIKEVTHER